ncbi:MAG: hypothetical protein IV100_25260 [Myxococcales bacterium]|nr:hypothetical protein [Myxococcales bacterium]
MGFSKKLLPDIVYDLISYEAGPGSICDEFWDEIPFDPTSESLISFSRIYEDGTGTCCDNTTFIGGRGYTCSGPVGREAPNGLYADLSGPGYVCCGVSKTVPPELCSDGPKAAFVQYYRFPRGSYTALRPEGVPEAAEALFQKLNLPDSYPPSPRAPEDPICDHWGYGLNERPIEVFE